MASCCSVGRKSIMGASGLECRLRRVRRHLIASASVAVSPTNAIACTRRVSRITSAAFLLERIGEFLKVEDGVGRLDADLQHGLPRAVGPSALQSLAMRAHDFPKVSSHPENIVLGAPRAADAVLIYFGGGLERLGFVAAADDLVEIRVGSRILAVIFNHLLRRIGDDLQRMALLFQRLQSIDYVGVGPQ